MCEVYNLGKALMLAFHTICVEPNNQDVFNIFKLPHLEREALIASWFPKSSRGEECLILNTVYHICDCQDGVCRPVRGPGHFSDVIDFYEPYTSIFDLLYLTSDVSYSPDFNKIGNVNAQKTISRWHSRHDYFIKCGLLMDGDPGTIGITFGGRKRLEELLDVEKQADIHNQLCELTMAVLDLRDVTDSGVKDIGKMVDIVERMSLTFDTGRKCNVGNLIQAMANMCTIICSGQGAINAVYDIAQNVICTINKVLP